MPLERTYSEWLNSDFAVGGVDLIQFGGVVSSCQDCHMGKIQGVPSGYDEGPAAVVGGEPTMARKLTNHFFAGPDYSVIHPGIFPHNAEAAAMAALEVFSRNERRSFPSESVRSSVPRVRRANKCRFPSDMRKAAHDR